MSAFILGGCWDLMDIIFHYPPELMKLLIDTIPLLNRSKNDVVLFFHGAGAPNQLMVDIRQQLKSDKESINKFEIVREILTRLNEQGEATLRVRREVLKRVVEFENFSVCWDSDRLKAKGLVAEIRDLVNVKDSFTRMKQERDKEAQRHRLEYDQKIRAQNQRRIKLEQIKGQFAALYSQQDPHKRGKNLETILNAVFEAYGISVRKAFTMRVDGLGVVEQIDGVIQLDGHLYLVEMKWHQDKLGSLEVSQHLVRVYSRGDVSGMFVSASGYTNAAVLECITALAQKTVVLCDLQEFYFVLEQEKDLVEILREKVRAAILDKKPYVHVG